ncbi:MAG: hypothetical protein U5K81_11525 [Trueperaceae bacterium]|nr:hypothetical protein [Trueperaceae bacterium]
MNRTRTLLITLGLLALGLVVAQGMMDGPNTQPWTNDGYQRAHHMGPGNGAMGYGGMGYGQRVPGRMAPGTRGMMGGGMMGGGMGMMQTLPAGATPLDDTLLRERLEEAAASFGPDARIADVMPFANHTYAQVVDGEDRGLAELLVDRYTGQVTPEPGPNMMWNRAGGMGYAAAPAERYDEAAARDLAKDFLKGFLPGAEILAGQAFPGYVTFDYGREGRVDGMLSVHATTGAIWPHAWHGASLEDAHD